MKQLKAGYNQGNRNYYLNFKMELTSDEIVNDSLLYAEILKCNLSRICNECNELLMPQ